jgi:hypothetical protein
MNKRGQFFLIAALVIVGIILGLSTVYVSTRAALKTDNSVYDLSNEIDYESNSVLDYGIVKNIQVSGVLENLSNYYAATNPDKDLIIVYGNQNDINGLFYKEESVDMPSVSTGGSSIREVNFYRTLQKAEGDVNQTSGKVTINFGKGNKYEFVLQPGENFYIVLRKTVQNETVVATRE